MNWFVISLVILVVIGIVIVMMLPKAARTPKELPYIKIGYLFSPAERSFYGVLNQAMSDEALIFGKVRVADVIAPKKGIQRNDWQKAFNKISSKHFDFLLCDKSDLSVLCAVELDDSSHNSKKRKARDEFLTGACQAANVPLVQIKARASYNINEIQQVLASYLPGDKTIGAAQAPVAAVENVATVEDIKHQKSNSVEDRACPKCLSILVKKTAKRGENAGNEFWACSAFPKCRYTEEIT